MRRIVTQIIGSWLGAILVGYLYWSRPVSLANSVTLLALWAVVTFILSIALGLFAEVWHCRNMTESRLWTFAMWYKDKQGYWRPSNMEARVYQFRQSLRTW